MILKINKTLAILAGGKSSRMNYNNKALLSYKEKTFIEHIIEAGENFKKVVNRLKKEIQKEIEQMKYLNGNQIVENRYMKFRNMGEFKEV